MDWTFHLTLDTQKILEGNWSFGAHSLFLNKMSVDFDATSKRVEISPILVCLCYSLNFYPTRLEGNLVEDECQDTSHAQEFPSLYRSLEEAWESF